jgi:hypothetical protein
MVSPAARTWPNIMHTQKQGLFVGKQLPVTDHLRIPVDGHELPATDVDMMALSPSRVRH